MFTGKTDLSGSVVKFASFQMVSALIFLFCLKHCILSIFINVNMSLTENGGEGSLNGHIGFCYLEQWKVPQNSLDRYYLYSHTVRLSISEVSLRCYSQPAVGDFHLITSLKTYDSLSRLYLPSPCSGFLSEKEIGGLQVPFANLYFILKMLWG